MCIACRTSAPKEALLRFVRAPDGSVHFDPAARVASRGAYTCPTPACVRRAVTKGGFGRAFEAPVIASADDLVNTVERVLEGEILRDLGLARRASQCVAGRTEALRGLDEGEVHGLIVARDLAPRSLREVVEAAGARAPVSYGPSKEALGHALGRGPTGVVGLGDGQVARRIVQNLERWNRFLGLLSPASEAKPFGRDDPAGEREVRAPG